MIKYISHYKHLDRLSFAVLNFNANHTQVYNVHDVIKCIVCIHLCWWGDICTNASSVSLYVNNKLCLLTQSVISRSRRTLFLCKHISSNYIYSYIDTLRKISLNKFYYNTLSLQYTIKLNKTVVNLGFSHHFIKWLQGIKSLIVSRHQYLWFTWSKWLLRLYDCAI